MVYRGKYIGVDDNLERINAVSQGAGDKTVRGEPTEFQKLGIDLAVKWVEPHSPPSPLRFEVSLTFKPAD
jgi:hypothetical protein